MLARKNQCASRIIVICRRNPNRESEMIILNRGMRIEIRKQLVQKKNEKGGGPGLPASLSPLARNPADLTEGGQPVVCWPSY